VIWELGLRDARRSLVLIQRCHGLCTITDRCLAFDIPIDSKSLPSTILTKALEHLEGELWPTARIARIGPRS
jgi:hypothetical protein